MSEKKEMLKSIVIEIQGKDISLSIEEAKELKEALDKLFTKETVVINWDDLLKRKAHPYNPHEITCATNNVTDRS